MPDQQHSHTPDRRDADRTLTRTDVAEICGRLDDMRVAAIIGTGASPAELMEARTWMASDDYLSGTLHRQPSGRVAALVELLRADEPDWDEQ